MRSLLSLITITLALSSINAKELFNQEKIVQYLSEKNPFVYDTFGEKYVYKAKEIYALGAFDTQISGKYDTKRYPASEGDFVDTTISKPMENGLELIAGYRIAEGTQEYNNIKTSEQGEFRIGVKVPIIELIKGVNHRKINLQTASLESIKFSFQAENNLRFLHRDILSSYHKLLYYNSLLQLENRLYLKAKERKKFIQKEVKVGSLPEVTLLEIEQQILNREQRKLSAQNDYSNALENFLKYLNFSTETFTQKYTLIDILKVQKKRRDIDTAIHIALRNRPDLKVFEYEKEKLMLEMTQAELLKYPNVNVGLYGVHDVKYQNGFKVSVDMNFPIEQRKHKGKHLEIQEKINNIENKREKSIIILKTNLTNLINFITVLEKNIKNSKEEIALVEKLEKVENKKYQLGGSTLFMVNQREISTLEVRKKLLQYHLNYLLLAQEADNEMGQSFEIPKR